MMMKSMRKYTRNEKIAGELAVRLMSEKAQRVYADSDPVEVYKWNTDDGETRYSVMMFGGWDEDLSFAEAERILEVEESETVYDEDGAVIDWEAAVALMDDEICAELHEEIAPCSNQEFFDKYCDRHWEKYGETFTV